MELKESAIVVGGIYITNTNQLRKITEIIKDNKGRKRVNYLSKSANIKNRKFEFGPIRTNPPLMKTFLEDCERKLSKTEIETLIVQCILSKEEI